MTNETDTPRTGGTIHPPAAIQAAAERLRRLLEVWSSADDIIVINGAYRLDPADLVAVLDGLDSLTAPTGFIEFPKALTEQEYEEAKAKWRETHGGPRITVQWVGPPADSDTLLKQVRRWFHMRPSGGGGA